MAQVEEPRLEDQIRGFIVSSLERPISISDGDRLIDRGYVPSMQLISLVGFLEDHFGVEVEPFDVTPETFESIATIAAYIRDRQSPR